MISGPADTRHSGLQVLNDMCLALSSIYLFFTMPDPKEAEPSSQHSASKETSSSSASSEPASSSHGQTSDNQSQPISEPTAAQVSTEPTNRTDLLEKARSFLQSPQVVHQDVPAKRAFLREKGLNEFEIDSLLQNLVRAYMSSLLRDSECFIS
jgi:hypothetical protein